MEFARYAASVAARDGADWVIFDDRVAAKLLQQARTAGEHGRGLEDYAKLVAMGVTSAFFHNAGGLLALENVPPEFERAIEAFKLATQSDPSERVFWLNRAYAEYANDAEQDALNSSLAALRLGEVQTIPTIYLRRLGIVCSRALAAGDTRVDRTITAQVLERALTDAMSKNWAKDVVDEIEQALALVQSGGGTGSHGPPKEEA